MTLRRVLFVLLLCVLAGVVAVLTAGVPTFEPDDYPG